MDETSPFSLKHRPVYLLPYEAHDGLYKNVTDCKYLSIGLAQYDPRALSVKTLRHTGDKWSRQSEEMPAHRAIDLVALLAFALEAQNSRGNNGVEIPADFLENQSEPIGIENSADNALKRGIFADNLAGESEAANLVRRRLGKLREVLDRLHDADVIP